MKINVEEIRNGQWDGEYVWVCQYNRPDVNKKPLRNVSPTRVLVRSNDELDGKKKIYYSESHLCKLNKQGEPLKSGILSPVDNTGFRMYCGNQIDAFTDEMECVDEWNRQLDVVRKEIEKQYQVITDKLNELDRLAE